jgi:hypothetical protein
MLGRPELAGHSAPHPGNKFQPDTDTGGKESNIQNPPDRLSLGRGLAFLCLDFAIEKHQIRSNSTYFIDQFYIGLA